MTKFERLKSVLNGDQPDRPPFSFWHHFEPAAYSGPAAFQAHIDHLKRFDVDFLKVMNDGFYPMFHGSDYLSQFEPDKFQILNGTELGFGRQLELLRRLSDEVGGKVPLITTVFSAWTVLRRLLMEPALNVRGVPKVGLPLAAVDLQINELLETREAEVLEVLSMITESQVNFVRQCLSAGADGIYFSIREDWPNLDFAKTTYQTHIEKCDLKVLAAAEDGWCNIIHLCGRIQNFSEFANFPGQILHWADRSLGPSISSVIESESVQKVLCGGIDHSAALLSKDGIELETQVLELLALSASHPLIIAPGCTYDPKLVPEKNLHAIRETIESGAAAMSFDFDDEDADDYGDYNDESL
jgi:uroporphyrinogen decarboxylase